MIRRIRMYYILTLFSFSMLGITFLIMPFTENAENQRQVLLIFTGTIFWISLITGTVCLIRLKILNNRMNIREKVRVNSGIIYKNITGTVSMAVLIINIIMLIALAIMDKIECYLIYINISMIIVSFALYFLSENSLYERLKKKRRREKNGNED